MSGDRIMEHGDEPSGHASRGNTPHVNESREATAGADPTHDLLDRLGTTISPDLLVEALTHRSFSHENPGAPNYERLEFLGDAVLGLVATESLYTSHPDANEGRLASMRANTVSEDALASIAREQLQVGPYILLGVGESGSGGADKSSILCDVVESLIGATFIEHGIEEASAVVHRLIDNTLCEVANEGPELDWKTSLTVKARDMGIEEPVFQMSVAGPQYAQVFTARAVLEDTGEVLGTGEGSSKRKAQLAAAEQAWHTLDAR